MDFAVVANLGLARTGTITVTGSTDEVFTVEQDAGSGADLSNGLIGYWSFNNLDGADGSGNGQFINPTGIAIDASGNVYVADCNNRRIQKFDSAGTYITQWGTIGTGNGQFNK